MKKAGSCKVENTAVSIWEELFEKRSLRRREALQAKSEKNSFELAFCGHFSAGKSSVINDLLGHDILPTSPIPTSANIISIKKGDVALELVDQEGGRQKWEQEIPWDKARKWGMDGNAIKEMTIFGPFPFLHENAAIIDTPGVDSTDPDHQKITASQLFTTDMIVYVTDYNHVQSETNIEFLQQLSREKKPIVLVINQIDKHNNNELSIQSFENAVRNMLAKSNIRILSLFFTSMKEESHPLNQKQDFTRFVKSVLYYSESLIAPSVKALETAAVYDLLEQLEDEEEEAWEKWEEEIRAEGMDPAALQKIDSAEENRSKEEAEKKEKLSHTAKERKQILENAILFPHTTTEKAKAWLESMDPGFKTGGLIKSKKKIEAEREKREAELCADLNEKIKKQMVFHLRDLLNQMETYDEKRFDENKEAIQQISFEADPAFLRSFISSQTTDRRFLYTFMEQVSQSTARHLKTQSSDLFDTLQDAVKNYYETRADRQKQEAEQSASYEQRWGQWKETKQQFENKKQAAKNWLHQNESKELQEQIEKVSIQEAPRDIPEMHIVQETESLISTEEYTEETAAVKQMDESIIPAVESYLEKFMEKPLFQNEKQALSREVHQFKNNHIKISLFGAFSAGKSSFINAMLGSNVLPVSPHPTTAAINRVLKSDDTHDHGTVDLHLKEESFLDKEIQAVSKEIGESWTFHTLKNWKRPSGQQANARLRTYYQHLYTLQQSINRYKQDLGTKKTILLDELQEWVAQEEKASMIKEVIVYYDCEWTRKGLELIDTPGVNSIHGRHTNVAFEQIRQSDAIFYVTYYNHAFSKADQIFLQQLNRANESFSQDKLFFLINASDLADSPAELNGVKSHVRDQLKRNGFQSPRLSAVSSKQALADKEEGRTAASSGFQEFETQFTNSVWHDLRSSHLASIQDRMRSIADELQRTLKTMNTNQAGLEEKKRKQEAVVREKKDELTDLSLRPHLPAFLQEIDEQCAYLIDRVTFGMNDYFTMAVNPAVISASSKKQQKEQLKNGIREVDGFVRQFVMQEKETLHIRIESFVKQKTLQVMKQKVDKWREDLPLLDLPVIEWKEWRSTIAFPSLEEETYAAMFRSSRDFFENKVNMEMKQQASDDIRSQMNAIVKRYQQELEKETTEMTEDLEKRTSQGFEQQLNDELERLEWLYDINKKPYIEEETKWLEAEFEKQ